MTTFDDLKKKTPDLLCRVYEERHREFGDSPFSKFLVIGNPLKNRSVFFFPFSFTKKGRERHSDGRLEEIIIQKCIDKGLPTFSRCSLVKSQPGDVI